LLENLPENCKPEQIARIVYGGRIYQINITPNTTTATVQFLLAPDAEKYLESAARGLRWPDDPCRVIRVSRLEQMDKPNAYQLALVGSAYTRVVVLRNLPADVTRQEMTSFACNESRRLEKLREKKEEDGSASFEISFQRLPDAITFMSAAQKKYKNIRRSHLMWGTDPCEHATNIHSGK
jgi:hypothetical protein